MTRIIAIVAIAVLLLGSPLVADLALQATHSNPSTQPQAAQQQTFIESAGVFLEAAPFVIFVGTIGVALAGVSAMRGGGR